MYDTNMSELKECKPCKPDYEKVARKQKAELMIIENFKESLLEFINVIGRLSLRQKSSSIPELLGTVELDIIERQKQHIHTLEIIEKDK